MCGFLAEYTTTNDGLTSASVFSELLQLSKHRGPDSSEITRGENFQLGFNRLSILDLSSGGNQPKQSPSKRFDVVFNGEIYNYKELEKVHDLKNLQSTSDTEVLIHLLDKIGIVQTIQSLNGMFAIAVVDNLEKTFNLTRDFSGIKPLFYGISEKGIVTASQFDQVYKHQWFRDKLKLRPEIVKEYFGFGYMQAPNTVYKNIFQVNPGELITFDTSGEIQQKQITEFKRNTNFERKEDDDIFDQYNSILDKVIKRQLVSDVPLATFLSGGIDSPLVTAHAKKNKSDILAITLKVDDKTLNESEIASKYAKALKVDQEVIEVEPSEILKTMEQYFDKCSEPFGDYSALPTFLLTKYASKDFKVMLSGDGGDELFYGYPRFRQFLEHYYLFKIPYGIRKPIVRLLNKFNSRSLSAPYYYKTFEQWQIAKHLHIFPKRLDRMVPNTSFSKETTVLYNFEKVSSKKDLLQSLRHNEFYAHMQRVLTKVDRASMANSIEVRVPLLDKESIDFAWYTDSNLAKHKILKKILKDCLVCFVPKKLINARKMGFTIPLDQWLKNELKEDVMHHIFEKPFYGSEIINVDHIKKEVKDFYNGGVFSAWGVWHIYAWQKWASKHVNQ